MTKSIVNASSMEVEGNFAACSGTWRERGRYGGVGLGFGYGEEEEGG